MTTLETELKLAIYRYTAEVRRPPSAAQMAAATGSSRADVRAGYRSLFTQRVLVLEADGETIRMAPPFSGVETQHRALVDGKEYFGNCAWDVLAIPAALRSDGKVFSRCEQSGRALELEVRDGSVTGDPCLVHYAVPASQWWDDIVYT